MKMIIVTGMSGAGKSTALNVLEDEDIIVSIICQSLLFLSLQSLPMREKTDIAT